MLGVNGKLYKLMTEFMYLFVINFLFTLFSMPIVTIPLALLYLCKLVLNLFQKKKLFSELKLSKAVWQKAVPTFVFTLFSMASSYLTLGAGLNFIGLFIVSVIVTVNAAIYLMILFAADHAVEMKLISLYRTAFLYIFAYFYKTILLCFGACIVGLVALNVAPLVIPLILFSGYAYLFVRLNNQTMKNIFTKTTTDIV